MTAVEKDAGLIERSRLLFPELPVVESDILGLSPSLLEHAGRPSAYDIVVVVGNVMVYLADGTETRALATMGALLAPGGRMLVGLPPPARTAPQPGLLGGASSSATSRTPGWSPSSSSAPTTSAPRPTTTWSPSCATPDQAPASACSPPTGHS